MKVRCNMCEGIFDEKDIVYDGEEDKEYCPLCGESGCLMDLPDEESKNLEVNNMKQIPELKFTMKYAGKKLDLSTEHLYPKGYEGHNMGDICLSAEYTVAVLEFSESLKEFEERHAYNTFTTNMDVEPNLSQLFMYMLNAYTEKDNSEGSYHDFREWCMESFEEIQDLIDEGEYVVCDYCKSIVPKEGTVTINGGFWEGRTVCFKCSNIINSVRK